MQNVVSRKHTNSKALTSRNNKQQQETTTTRRQFIMSSQLGAAAPALTAVNKANVAAYILNVLVTFGIGGRSNAIISEKYQSLVTPSGWAFSIWGVIFLAQAVFTVVQTRPDYSNHVLVQKGVGYKYAVACIFQAMWTICFTEFEYISLSFVAMSGILISLWTLFVDQRVYSSNSKKDGDTAATSSNTTNLLLVFPFSIHFGWIMAAWLVNLNVVLVAAGGSELQQLILAALSLLIIWFLGVYVTNIMKPPSFTIGLVMLWTALGITAELTNPIDSIAREFHRKMLDMGRNAAAMACLSLSLMCLMAYFVPDDRVPRVSERKTK
mmetsp:Transcript_15911/g.24220  ORF Transcript_15911/g.24220 Transcript_15911/m.24220 type:complete len:324 (+) Transcript_15911:273-1244(+)